MSGRRYVVRESGAQDEAPVLRTAKPCGPGAPTLLPTSFAFSRSRDGGMMQVICPTCQVDFVESEVVVAARLLCMGLFSMFWVRGALAMRGRYWIPLSAGYDSR